MTNSELHQNVEILRSQINQLVAAVARDEEADEAQLEDKSEDVSAQPPAPLSSVNITELDHRLKSLYQPQIGSMQHQMLL